MRRNLDSYKHSEGETTVPLSGICGEVSVSNHDPVNPEGFNLAPIYPNPFNSSAVIEFSIPSALPVNLTLYNIQGKPVDILYTGQAAPGTHIIEFNGGKLSSGIYYCTLTAPGYSATEKIIYIK